MEEELDEFGIPIKKPAEEAKPVKAKAQKVEVDEFGIPIKKKEGTTQDSGQPVQPSAQSGGPDQASIDRQKTLLYQIKKAHKDFIKESEQALNDGWDVDYTKKYFADKQNYLAAMLDELDNLGGDQVRQWTGGMRSAIDNSKQNVIKQRDSWFSDPENLYQEDRGNQEWFNINTKEIEGILSGRQVNRPKEGLPEIKAPKKQVLSGEVPSLREIVQKPQEEMFKPEKDDYNADRLKLAVHQEARDKYKELAKFTTNVNLSIDQNADVTYNGAEIDYNLLIQNEDVWKKYVGEDLPWPGGVYEPNPQKRADIKKEAERRIKEKLASANELVEQSIDSKVIKDIVDKNFNENTYAHFLTTSGDRIGFKVTQPVVDVNKISEQVDKIVEHYGLDPKGSVAIDLYDKAVSTVQYESDRYRIDEKFKEEFPEEYNLREKYKSGKFQEEINAKFISELESTYSLYESQANEEIGSIYGAAKKQAETLSVQYNQQVDEFKRQAEELGRAYQNNEIDELTYQDALGKINGQLSELSEAFKAMLPNQDELNAQANKIYSRYNTEFERKKAAIIKIADEELKSAANIPTADLEKINKAYQAAYDGAYKEKNSELYREIKLAQQESPIPFYQARRSLANGLGTWIKDMGSYTDSYGMKVFGEAMQNRWSSAAPDLDKLGLNTDTYYEIQNILGNMFGYMAPALTTTILTTAATRGATAAEGIQFMTGWIANWASETAARAGANSQSKYSETGDIRLAEQAGARTIDSQQDIFLSYALDGLGFTGAGYRMVSGFTKGVGAGLRGKLARAGVGAAFEVSTETFTQEIPQSISDENILKNNKDPWTNFGEMYSGARISETLKAVAPIGIIGAIGGYRTKSLAQQRADKAMAFENKATLYGGFEDQRRQYLQGLVFDKDEKYARAVVSAMFTTGNITEVEATEMQKQITHANELKTIADREGLNRPQRNVYGFFAARADEARRNADKNNQDPILMKMYRQQQSDYERMGAEYLQGKSPDLLTLTYSDGTTMMMTREDAKGLSENKDFLDALAKKKVTVTGYGNTKPVLDELQTSVNNHKTKSIWDNRVELSLGFAKDLFKPGLVDIEDKKPSEQQIKAQENQAKAAYNNTNDLREALKSADNFLSTIVSNPLWSNLTDDGRNSIKSIAGQMRADRQLMENSDQESNEYKQAQQRISDNEKAVYDILNSKVDDTQNIQGVSGQVGVGQKPVETQPVQGTGTETTTAGGVLQAQEEVSGDPKERVLNSITEQDFIDNAPAITTGDIERIKASDAAKQQAAEKARKEAESAYAYLEGQKTAKEFLSENGYDVEGMSDEDAKKFADSDADYWKNKLAAEEAKGGKKLSKGKKPGRTKEARIAQKEQESLDLIDKGVQESTPRVKELIANGMTPDQAYETTRMEWLETADGKKYTAIQEEIAKLSQEQAPAPSRKKKKQEAPKMPEKPTTGQQRIATINNLEEAVFKSATGEIEMSLEESNQAQATIAEMKKQNKKGGLTEVELAMKKALGEKVVTRTDVDDMIKEKKVKEKCPPKTKKAEHGMSFGFRPGGKWQVVKEFKGKSHANGGIDIEVAGGSIRYTGKSPKLEAKNGGFWNVVKDIGYTGIDTALGTIGNVAGIKSMQDIIDEDQYSNDKFDTAANFSGKLVGTALKVIPVTAPIASAAGAVGGIVNNVAGIDAKNYDPTKHTGKLDKAGDIISTVGTVAGMAVGAGVASGASKAAAAGEKLTAAQNVATKMSGINKALSQASKGASMLGGMNSPAQPLVQQVNTQQPPAQQPVQPQLQPQVPYFPGSNPQEQQMVMINGVNYVPDQFGNLTPVT